MTRQAISGVILAGGLGRRMGGADKGLQLLSGKPLVQWTIERLRPQVDELLINANREIAVYEGFGYPVISDRFAGFAGPLAGLHSALASAAHSLVACVPCDSPLLPADLVGRLYDALQADGSDLASARTFNQRQPVFCLCRRALLPQLVAFLDGGGRQPSLWYRTLKASEVAFDDEAAAFRNVNTRQDLAQLANDEEWRGAVSITAEP
jgi:molybdopterin-guanine dinucleotide biosynthesis protein A